MYLHLLGADHGPAALGLDVAHGRLRGWIPVSHAVAVRHLEEPVLGADRPQLHRLEQDVVTAIARGGTGRRDRVRSRQVVPDPAFGLPPEVEELRPEYTRGEKHEDDPDADDGDQRPDLRRRSGLQRLDQDPAEEPGGGQRQHAEDHPVQDVAEDTAPVVDDGGERGKDVEGGVQQGRYGDRVVEGVGQRGGEQVGPGQSQQGQADQRLAATGVENRRLTLPRNGGSTRWLAIP